MPAVDSLVIAVLKAAGIVGGFCVFFYLLYRGVSAAKKAGKRGFGGEVVVGLLIFLGTVVAPVPPREATTESREQKRDQDQDESGDPEHRARTEAE